MLNENGQKLISYTYDPHGSVSTTTHIPSPINNLNPFKYRSYYYDSDLGLYYLNSRYYDQSTGRFINIDGFIGVNNDLLSNNLYLYCSNNSVNFYDSSGASKEDYNKELLLAYAYVPSIPQIPWVPIIKWVMPIGIFAIASTLSGTLNDYLDIEKLKKDFENLLKSVVIAVGVIVTITTYRSSFEWHHIVAQNAPEAKSARCFMNACGLDTEIEENLVFIKTRFHRLLTQNPFKNIYYPLVNKMIESAFNAANGNYDLQRTYIKAALVSMQIMLYEYSYKSFY